MNRKSTKQSFFTKCLLAGARLRGHRYFRHCLTADHDIKTLLPFRILTSQDLDFYLGRQAGSRNLSRFSDLMDTISGMREDDRLAWEAEYTPDRQQSALGRRDAEYKYWRRMQARF